MIRARLALLILLTTTACTDLSAVRDYANTASAVTANASIFRQWPTTYATAIPLSGEPQVRSRYPEYQAQLRQEMARDVARAQLAILATQSLTLYLTTLGKLADDKVPDVSQQSTDINAGLGKLGADPTVTAVSSAVFKVVGVILDAVRRRAIADLIANANDDIKTITKFLAEEAAPNVRKANVNAIKAADQYWSGAIASTHDVGMRALLFRARMIDLAAFDAPIVQADAAQAAFKKIGEDQAVLYENRNRLQSRAVREALLKDIPVLLDAIRSFQKP